MRTKKWTRSAGLTYPAPLDRDRLTVMPYSGTAGIEGRRSERTWARRGAAKAAVIEQSAQLGADLALLVMPALGIGCVRRRQTIDQARDRVEPGLELGSGKRHIIAPARSAITKQKTRPRCRAGNSPSINFDIMSRDRARSIRDASLQRANRL